MIAVILHDKPLLFLSSENHNSNVKSLKKPFFTPLLRHYQYFIVPLQRKGDLTKTAGRFKEVPTVYLF